MRNKWLFLGGLCFVMAMIIQSCENEQSLNYKRYYVNGKGLYEKNCQSCHGADGRGLGTLYPPLTDSTYLISNKTRLAYIIRNGQNEEIIVDRIKFKEQMPGNQDLADIDIAQIIVYISNSFGNDQGFYDASRVTSDLTNCN